MSDLSIALVTALSIVTCLACTAGVIYWKRDVYGVLFSMLWSSVVAKAEAEPLEPHAFSLSYDARKSGIHRVCLQLRLRNDSYPSVGLACTFQVSIGGQVVAKEVVGYGGQAPEPFDRHITLIASHTTSSGSSIVRSGTVILTELDRCTIGAAIAVEGTIKLAPGTQTGPLIVSIRA